MKAKIEGAKASYEMTLKYEGEDEETKININMNMTVEISVKDNDLTWEITKIDRKEGTDKIASIDIPQLNLLSVDQVEENREEIAELYNRMKTHYQKVGIVKYDAFDDVGGKMSFALAMLDKENTGFILNAIHSRDNCFLYLKEIVNGESYIMLSAEEIDALRQAITMNSIDLM